MADPNYIEAHNLLLHVRPDAKEYGQILGAVKFDLGDIAAFEAMGSLSTLSFWRPPFPTALFQVSDGQNKWLVLATTENDECVHLTCFYRADFTSGRWEHASIHLRIWFDGKALGFYNHDGEDITEVVTNSPDSSSWASLLTDVARTFEVFSCCNVVQVEHKAPRFINVKRASKKLPPIFEYRTLHIAHDEERAVGPGKGGTHASPRLHLRRGHIRRLPTGVRVWVRSAVVGSRDRGFVAKQYAVTA
jgi:hypothetical protein